jgi:hypothetical protein
VDPGSVSRRKFTYKYYLPIAGEKLHVCKKFFLRTLDISDYMVIYNVESKISNGGVGAKQMKRPAHNKTAASEEDFIKKHINSFPRIESHYCRANTKQEYLEAGLTIREMYRLYKEACQKEVRKPVSEGKYRQVFNDQFNIAFHMPSKDLCDTCETFKSKQSTGSLAGDDEEKQAMHLERKTQARVAKEADKTSTTVLTAAFDLQQVMSCPKLRVGSAYYLRKLNVYNLRIR